MPKSPKTKAPTPVNNAWVNGSFYLVAVVVVLALIAYISKQIAWYALPIVLIAGLLLVGVVGALQLKNDKLLKDESFVQLMIETYKRLPLLKNQSR